MQLVSAPLLSQRHFQKKSTQQKDLKDSILMIGGGQFAAGTAYEHKKNDDKPHTLFIIDKKGSCAAGEDLVNLNISATDWKDNPEEVINQLKALNHKKNSVVFLEADVKDKVSLSNAIGTIEKAGFDIKKASYELEGLSTSASLVRLLNLGERVLPGSNLLASIQDKYHQNKLLEFKGFDVPQYEKQDTLNDLRAALYEKFVEKGESWVVKVRRGTYDGAGVMLFKVPEDLKGADKRSQREAKFEDLFQEKVVDKFTKLQKSNKSIDELNYAGYFVLERYIDMDPNRGDKEFAVIVARSDTHTSGRKKEFQVKVYNPAEMRYDPDTNQLVSLITKNPMSKDKTNDEKQLYKQLTERAKEIVKKLGIFGLSTIEFFVTKKNDGKFDIYVNEIAPRLHNSGHYTTIASQTSMFRQVLNLLKGEKLGEADLLKDVKAASALINITGPKPIPGYEGREMPAKLGINTNALKEALVDAANTVNTAATNVATKVKTTAENIKDSLENFVVTWYNKGSRPGRKLGHISMTGNNDNYLVALHDQVAKNLDRIFRIVEKDEPAERDTHYPETGKYIGDHGLKEQLHGVH